MLCLKKDKMYDIITVGGAVVDAFVRTNALKKKGFLSYPAGEKIIVNNLDFASGGGATNTAVSFSKLGLKTGCITKIGKDNNGKIILNDLKKEKVKFLGVESKENTGFSVILIGKENNRTILQEKGASENLRFTEINQKNLKTKWFYFSSSINKALKTQIKLAKWANKKGIKIAFNPSSYLTKKGPNKIKKILKYSEILTLNKEEAQDLVKTDLFNKLHKLGPKIVCITDGEKGTKVSDRQNIYFAKARKIKVRERTGAGDAFASGFVVAIIRGKKVKDALKIGTANAESVIRIKGAKKGLLSWSKALKEAKKIKLSKTD